MIQRHLSGLIKRQTKSLNSIKFLILTTYILMSVLLPVHFSCFPGLSAINAPTAF